MGAPPMCFVLTVLIGVQHLDARALDAFAAGVEDPGVQKKRFADIALAPEAGFGRCDREVLRSGTGLGGWCAFLASLR